MLSSDTAINQVSSDKPAIMQSSDVDEALANAAALSYVAGAEADEEGADEVVLQGGELTNRCRNPFCSNVLANCYAHYCEKRWVCQQHRALKLQCLANAERAAVQDVEALGRENSFLTTQAQEQPRSKTRTATENEVADESYVIPRRKRPRTIRTGAVEVHSASRSSEPYQPWRATTRRSCSTGGESRKRKRSRLGRGMRFTEVLAPFEPRTSNSATFASSCQAWGLGIQETAQKSPVPHASPRAAGESRSHAVIRQSEQNFADGGRSGNGFLLPSTPNLPRMPRPTNNPIQPDVESAIAQTGNNHRANAVPVAPLVLPSQTEQLPRRNASPIRRSIEAVIPDSSYDTAWNNLPPRNGRFSSAERPQLGHEDHLDEYRPNSAPQTDADLGAGSIGRSEDYSLEPTVELSRVFSAGHESCRAYLPQYDGAGNRIACEENYDRDLDAQGTAQQEEGWRSDTRSLFFRNDSDTRSSRCANEPNRSAERPLLPFLSEQRPNGSANRVSTSESVRPFPHDAGHIGVDTDDDDAASFSFHDPFIVEALSQSIRYLPTLLEPVMNVTKKPRKMQWYIDYLKKIERTCSHLRVQLKDKRVLVTIHNRVWIDVKGSSTTMVLRETIQRLRAEAIAWNSLKSEVEHSLDIYKTRQGDTVDLSSVFTRAWNNLKSRAGDTWQSNYFRGARLHHWNFVVGKVEIGSGSHEEKREAFRLAAISAAEFLLRLDDGQNDRRWRPSCDESDSGGEDVEFMFVRSAGSAPIAADALITISDSSSSTSEDVVQTGPPPSSSTSQNEQDDNDVKSIAMPSHDHSLAAATSAEAFSSATTPTVWSSSFEPARVAPSDEESMAVAAVRPCRVCEIIRMRKPASAGCRQCQMTDSSRNVDTHEV